MGALGLSAGSIVVKGHQRTNHTMQVKYILQYK